MRACPLFTQNNLNRDFVATRGFSVVFTRAGLERANAEFPCFQPYLRRVMRQDCNAFYLNPLQLEAGSRVDPHNDRSLRSYCTDVEMPLQVTVLYVEVPPTMVGGRLVLARGKRILTRIQPRRGLLVEFDGDLTHSVEKVETAGSRLSLVCEQYSLLADELELVPDYAVESRAGYGGS